MVRLDECNAAMKQPSARHIHIQVPLPRTEALEADRFCDEMQNHNGSDHVGESGNHLVNCVEFATAKRANNLKTVVQCCCVHQRENYRISAWNKVIIP